MFCQFIIFGANCDPVHCHGPGRFRMHCRLHCLHISKQPLLGSTINDDHCSSFLSLRAPSLSLFFSSFFFLSCSTMTEYDYSPEAYERYLATQTRIANWVDKTEQNRPHFEPAVPSGPPANPSRPSYDPLSRPKQTPPSPPHYHPLQYAQPQQRRQLYIHPPPPESESSDGYGDGPGPMPLPSPGMMFSPQPAYHHPTQPMGHPMLSPLPMMMPQTYMNPPHKSSRQSHRPHSLRSHSHSRSHRSPTYYNMASPPVSPGYQYQYPPAVGGGQPGYIMMQPHRGSQVPIMVSTSST